MAIYDIRVDLKRGVSDAEGRNVAKALRLLGFDVSDVRVSKAYRIEFTSEDPDADVEVMCQRLLANPVIQDYSIERID
ncbi:MAG: phosphoribosylformylglycinamidine synthase subunit PurS [Thermoplasmata archaeon]|nr:phosphoribosylformylglycinamidine synthase subunit PurS [Thermoplasmata archaeon]